jgi:hypothetical protein
MEGAEIVTESDPMGLRQLPARDAERTASEINGAAYAVHWCRGVRAERLRRKDLVSDGVLARIEDTIYVMDCFEKDTAKTERKDLNTATSRLSQVKQRILEERKREKRKQ